MEENAIADEQKRKLDKLASMKKTSLLGKNADPEILPFFTVVVSLLCQRNSKKKNKATLPINANHRKVY